MFLGSMTMPFLEQNLIKKDCISIIEISPIANNKMMKDSAKLSDMINEQDAMLMTSTSITTLYN